MLALSVSSLITRYSILLCNRNASLVGWLQQLFTGNFVIVGTTNQCQKGFVDENTLEKQSI